MKGLALGTAHMLGPITLKVGLEDFRAKVSDRRRMQNIAKLKYQVTVVYFQSPSNNLQRF